MLLYQIPYSHYCAKVRVVLEEKGIAFDMPPIPGASIKSPEYLTVNPFGKVPTMDDDGLVLGESGAICEYLEEKHPDPKMLPDDPKERAMARWLSGIQDNYFAPRMNALFAGIMSNRTQEPEVQAELDALFHHLTVLEKTFDPKPYFFGDRFCLCDAAYSLSFWWGLFLAEKYGKPITSSQFPRLMSWFQATSSRPSVVKVIEDAKKAVG